jgi:lytic cellulose monooxygenase (C1-hydroxylating)
MWTWTSAHGRGIDINPLVQSWNPYGPASQPGTINRYNSLCIGHWAFLYSDVLTWARIVKTPFYQNGPPTPFSSGTPIIRNGNNLPANASATATAGSTITVNWDWCVGGISSSGFAALNSTRCRFRNSVHPGPVFGHLAEDRVPLFLSCESVRS